MSDAAHARDAERRDGRAYHLKGRRRVAGSKAPAPAQEQFRDRPATAATLKDSQRKGS